MHRIKLFKKFMLPCGLCAAVPLMKSNEDKPKNVSDVSDNKNSSQPTDLGPYYRPPTGRVATEEDPEPGPFEKKIGVIRRSVQDKIKTVSHYKNSVTETFNTGYAHSKSSIVDTLDYLREESNVLPRFGAVGIGALSGLILGLRGGKFKRFVYSSSGALFVASICYPKETEEGLQLLKYYFNISYNFVTGVKPEVKETEEVQQTNFSKISDMVSNSFVGNLYSKITKAYNDFSATPEPPGEKSKKS